MTTILGAMPGEMYWWHDECLRELARVDAMFPQTNQVTGDPILGHSIDMLTWTRSRFIAYDAGRYLDLLTKLGYAYVAQMGEFGPEYRATSIGLERANYQS